MLGSWLVPKRIRRPGRAPRSGDGGRPVRRSSRPPGRASSRTATRSCRPVASPRWQASRSARSTTTSASKQQLILAVLAAENERLLERQRTMYAGPEPFWVHWERACEFLEARPRVGLRPDPPGDDRRRLVRPGGGDGSPRHARRLVRAACRRSREREEERIGGLGPFTPAEVAALMALPFLGAESMILLGFSEAELPARSALRKIGVVIRESRGRGRGSGMTATREPLPVRRP